MVKRAPTPTSKKPQRRADRPAYYFHFTPRARYEELLPLGQITPYANPQTAPRDGISLSDLDPRSRTAVQIAVANWKNAGRAWKAAAFLGLPAHRVRRPKHVPKSHEWTTTQGVRLGHDCFAGVWNEAAQRYEPDPRDPFGPWPA